MTTTRGFKCLFVLAGLFLVHSAANPECLNAEPQIAPAGPIIAQSGQYSTVAAVPGAFTSSAFPAVPQVSESGAGLTIIPTFNDDIDTPTRAVINNAIAFYQNTFTNNITVNIEFHNMSSGLGQSLFFIFDVPYSTYRTALAANSASADDAAAIANTPAGSSNPINGGANISMKSADGRAVGLDTPELAFSFGGSPCPAFTGSGCIGLNVTLANSLGNLMAVVEHEIDEVLGLGSALSRATTPANLNPYPEDLFRWAGPGVRSFSANSSSCTAPAAFFSVDGGATNLDQFNNCNNGGDYGDWITHTPSQVQDAFTNSTASPSLSATSPEVRALDVIGYNIGKKRRGQLVSD